LWEVGSKHPVHYKYKSVEPLLFTLQRYEKKCRYAKKVNFCCHGQHFGPQKRKKQRIISCVLSDWSVFEKKLTNTQSRKRAFICILSAYLKKDEKGYCVCQIFFVPLQRFMCALALGDWIA
jgi:hypothetical protein